RPRCSTRRCGLPGPAGRWRSPAPRRPTARSVPRSAAAPTRPAADRRAPPARTRGRAPALLNVCGTALSGIPAWPPHRRSASGPFVTPATRRRIEEWGVVQSASEENNRRPLVVEAEERKSLVEHFGVRRLDAALDRGRR